MATGCWDARGCLVRRLVGEVLQPAGEDREGPRGTLVLVRGRHAGDNHACIQKQNMRGQSSCRKQHGGQYLSLNPQITTPPMMQPPVAPQVVLFPHS